MEAALACLQVGHLLKHYYSFIEEFPAYYS